MKTHEKGGGLSAHLEELDHFDPMVIGAVRFDSDEERAAALWNALEESLDDEVIEDFDHEAFVRELNERWRSGEI